MSGRDDIVTDESAWPIVVHSTVGIPSESDVDAFIARADALLARGERHAVVFDNSRGGRIPSYMRQRSIEWVKRNKEPLERLCVAKALVIRSAALRFVMTTIMLVTSHRVPEEVFATVEQALEWSRRELEAAGVSVPVSKRRSNVA